MREPRIVADEQVEIRGNLRGNGVEITITVMPKDPGPLRRSPDPVYDWAQSSLAGDIIAMVEAQLKALPGEGER